MSVVHDAVVALGICNQAGVLHGVEEGLGVAIHELHSPPQKRLEHLDRLALAGTVGPTQGGATVGSRVALPRREAAVALPRHSSRRWILFVEEAQNLEDRGVEAVEVEAGEADPALARQIGVVVAQPLHELVELLVAPHPGREAGERLPLLRRHIAVAHVVVNAGGVGPIGLDSDDVEAFALDERLGDPRAHPIELGGPVRRLSEEHDAGVADSIHQRVEGGILHLAELLGLLGQLLREGVRPGPRGVRPGGLDVPSLLSDQGNEAHPAEILFAKLVHTRTRDAP